MYDKDVFFHSVTQATRVTRVDEKKSEYSN